MMSVLKNFDGYVYAYAEWQVLDDNGQFKNDGENIYVQNIWIHPEERGYALRLLALQIYTHQYSRKCKWVYWAVARDKENKKILENEERPFTDFRVTRRYDKHEIFERITKSQTTQMPV